MHLEVVKDGLCLSLISDENTVRKMRILSEDLIRKFTEITVDRLLLD
jgi:hypothetical protein